MTDLQNDTSNSLRELEEALLGFKGGYGAQSLSSLMRLIEHYASQREQVDQLQV